MDKEFKSRFTQKETSPMTAPEAVAADPNNIYEVTCLLNLREFPSMEARIVRVVGPGDKVEVIEEAGEWAKIKDGYFMKKFLKKI